MNVKLATSILVGVLIIPSTGFTADISTTVKNVASEVKETVGDATITTKIKADYAKDKQVSAMNIKVDTDQKGMVVLSGNAKTRAEADKAVSIAKATKGVTSVRNDIKVQP